MNTYTYQFQKSKQREVVSLFMKATIGASGAVTLSSSTSIGIASITKESGAGNYTIVLSNKYARLLGVNETQLLASATGSTAPSMLLLSETVSTTKTIVLQFFGADGTTEADMASGTVLMLRIDLADVAGR